ncbi:MAG: hypothetical protein GY856_52785 [bacterium]|nr:hypothetical protein [bacterium]
MDGMTCMLPGGYVDETGEVHRRAELAPLSGREEELLAGADRLRGAELVTGILSRCVRRLGIRPVSEEAARQLLVADRQYLLLMLRRITFGDRIEMTIVCPQDECGEKIDLNFSVDDVPVKESQDKGPIYAVELSPAAAVVAEDGTQYREVRFRLPTGGDQEILSPRFIDDEAEAVTALLRRSICAIGPREDPGEELVAGLSPLAQAEIERRMEAVAPAVELEMAAHCPQCERPFAVPFDLQEYVLGEFRTSRELLYREVHYLAYHYHWSEREILEMPREKRRHYIGVLADEIERMNDAV